MSGTDRDKNKNAIFKELGLWTKRHRQRGTKISLQKKNKHPSSVKERVCPHCFLVSSLQQSALLLIFSRYFKSIVLRACRLPNYIGIWYTVRQVGSFSRASRRSNQLTMYFNVCTLDFADCILFLLRYSVQCGNQKIAFKYNDFF